ncbi:hypothetical protein ACFPA8_09760 [Streptomyces ovatisporus]|uniref:Uncharacterized protein n=1 Tax=Streptomyces ovatisporus TaxID=1128682 RepID=A0ABV9A5Q3_9ACTN
MGNTSFILVRSAQRDELTGPATQFAELTGAYWLEPIYARLASEWSRQGRTVPGSHSGRLRLLTDGAEPTAPADPPEAARPGDAPGSDSSQQPVAMGLTLDPTPPAGVTVLPGRAARTGSADGADRSGEAGRTGPRTDAGEPA